MSSMDLPGSPSSPPPSRPKRGVARPDNDTPAAIAAWEAEIVERTRRDNSERRIRQGSSGGDSSNMSVKWADDPSSSSPRSPTSPGSVSRRGFIQDPLPSPSLSSNPTLNNSSRSSIIRSTSSRPNTAGSETSRSRRSESINSIGQASITSASPRSPPPSSGFIDYSSKRRSSVLSDGSAGSSPSPVGGPTDGITSKMDQIPLQQQSPLALSPSPSSSSVSQKPSFLEEYGLQMEGPNRGSPNSNNSGRNASRLRGLIGKDKNSSGSPIIPKISSPLLPGTSTTNSRNALNDPTSPTVSQTAPASAPVKSDPLDTIFPSQASQTSPDSPSSSSFPNRARLDSDASFYPPDSIPIFKGTSADPNSNLNGIGAGVGAGVGAGSESVASHSSSEAKVRGVSNSTPRNEVDLVRSALAGRDGSGSLEYDYSDLVETSESEHDRDGQPASSSSSNLPPGLPPRKVPTLPSDGGVSTGIETSRGPPALPRRPQDNSSPSVSPQASISSHVETKAERKEREAAEKLKVKNEKLRIKEEANAEKQRLKYEAARAKEEGAAKILKDQEEAKREKERIKWRKEKKKNEEVERSILEASVEELEIAQFLNAFGKHVHEVRAIAPLEPDEAEVEWPRKADWMSGGGGVLAYIGYSAAVLTAIASYLSPRGPTQISIPEGKSATRIGIEIQDPDSKTEQVSEEDEVEFSLDALKSNGERLYLTALPMYETLFSTLIWLGRWDSPLTTGVSFLVYSICWWNGILLPGLFALMIFFTLKLKAVPIKPDALRKVIALQNKRQNELKDFEDGFKNSDGGKESSREVENERAEGQRDGIKEKASTSAVPPSTSKIEKEASKEDSKDSKGKYNLAADATKKYGTILTYHTSNLADLHERIKNFFYWKSPSATTRSLCWLLILMFSTLFLSPQILTKIPGAALGVAFFFILPIAQRRPEWLPVMANPIELLLAGVPNDAQVAIGLMRKRALYGKPLIGDQRLLISPDFLKNHELFENEGLAGMDEEAITDEQLDVLMDKNSRDGENGKSQTPEGGRWNQWRSKIEKGRDMAIKGSEMINGQRGISLGRIQNQDQGAYGLLARGVNSGLSYGEKYHREKFGIRTHDLSKDPNNKLVLREQDLINQPDGFFFSILNGTSGHLIVGNHRIVFKSIFAQKLSSEDQKADGDENHSEETAGKEKKENQKQKVIIEVNLDQISSLRKTKSLNLVVWSTDGLNIKLKNGETLIFSNMLKRDEAFNRILALSPSHWSKV